MSGINNHLLITTAQVDDSNTPVLITVKSLFGQPARIGLQLDQDFSDSFDDQCQQVSIGTNTNLPGKKLRITASVVDKNINTDTSGVEFKVAGIPDPVDNTLFWVIKPSGSHVDYRIDIFFSRT